MTAESQPSADEQNEWLARARLGDTRAFERIYREHSGKVYGLCLRLTRDPATAEDCTQETFISAWRNLPGFEGRSALGTWLHRIAVNAALARSRKGSLEIVPQPAGEDEDTPYEGQAADETPPMDLEAAVGSLPEGARHVLVLYGIYGYTHEEAAGMLGIAVGTCKAQLHRARRLLRERLDA